LGVQYDDVRKAGAIWKAWSVIQENGRHSKSARTRAEIADFGSDAPRKIARIVQQLRRRTFRFQPAHGIAVKKANKSKKRPLVLAPIENRIVQRAILDVVQQLPAINAKLHQGVNFGGVQGRGVPEAVEAAWKAARANGYYVRTDIQSFFVNVPKEQALGKIFAHVEDLEFQDLMRGATTTELANIAALGRDRELFPLADIGVAQGSSLSPLLCNLLLEELDAMLNCRGVRCIRYIDDFILFAPDRARARAALKSARLHLKERNLDCYDPSESSDKAEEGPTTDHIAFLGCEIWPDRIRPSRDTRRRLMANIAEATSDSLAALHDPVEALLEGHTYIDTLATVGNIVRGWGNTYAFCTDDRLMDDLDRQVDDHLAAFRARYYRELQGRDALDRRRLVGVFSLRDCNRDSSVRRMIEQVLASQTPQPAGTPATAAIES